MLSYLPTMLVRTAHTRAAVEVNGTILGECGPEGYLSIPLSDQGEYYVSLLPLLDDSVCYYPVTRRFVVREGKFQPPKSGDVAVYAWPGNVYEAVMAPGRFPKGEERVFPYTVAELTLPDGCIASLYYDGGLRLAVEKGGQLRFGTLLSPAREGRLQLGREGLLIAMADGEKGTLLVLDRQYRVLLRIEGDTVDWRGEEAVAITKMDTLLGHERRKAWRYRPGQPPSEAFLEQPEKQGFFSHSPKVPQNEQELMQAFCESVRHGFFEEAEGYMTPGLQEGLGWEMLQTFFGDFLACRRPAVNGERLLGLSYAAEDGVCPVRVFAFTFSDGKIDDVHEEA